MILFRYLYLPQITTLKLHLLLFYPSTWYFCHFFLFNIEIEGKCGWIIWGGGGGGEGYVGPLLKLLGGGGWPPWPPSSYAYGYKLNASQVVLILTRHVRIHEICPLFLFFV